MEYKVTNSRTFTNGVVHEVHDTKEAFRHRLRLGHKLGTWVPYSVPATLSLGGLVHYVAVTEYYKDSDEFPDPTKLYSMQAIPATE